MTFDTIFYLELLASFFMGGAVILARKGKVLNWIFSLFACVLYAYIMYSKGLVGQVLINAVFFTQGVIGLVLWKKDHKKELSPRRLGKNRFILYTIFIMAVALVLREAMFSFNLSSQPDFDAFTTAFSVFGISLLWFKIIEIWIYAFVVDVVSVFMFSNGELYLTALLYFLFALNAVYAFYQWNNIMRNSRHEFSYEQKREGSLF